MSSGILCITLYVFVSKNKAQKSYKKVSKSEWLEGKKKTKKAWTQANKLELNNSEPPSKWFKTQILTIQKLSA